MRSPVLHPPGFVREAVKLAPARPDYKGGLRAALAATVPMVLAGALGQPDFVWTSLAGFNTALVDKGGAYRTRARSMAAYGLFGALAMMAGTWVAPHAWAAVALLLAVVTACGYVRVLGAEATSVGLCVATTLVVALALPSPPGALLVTGLHRGAFTLLGSVWIASGSLLLWPVRLFAPARRAVASGLRELAGLTEDLAATAAGTDARRRERLGRVRLAIETARATLGTLRRGRPGTSQRAEVLHTLVEGSDLLFGAVIAVGDALLGCAPGAAAPVQAHAAARQLAAVLVQLASAMEAETPLGPVTLPARPTEAPGSFEERSALSRLSRLIDAAAELVQTARALDGPAAPAPTSGRPEAAPVWRPPRGSARKLLRENLTLDSAILRHALRSSLTTAAVLGVMKLLQLSHGYWATLTCLVILQPHGVATFAKAFQRVVGTLVGAGLAILVASWLHDGPALVAAIFLFAATSVAVLPINYGAFAVFLTPSFVLMAERGAGDWGLAEVRVLNTLVGAAMALAGARLLFPLSERDQFRPLMATGLDALHTLLDVAAKPEVSEAELKPARRAVGLSLINAEASFQRRLTEHAPASEESEALGTLLLYGHRLAAGLVAMALDADPRARTLLDARAPVLGAALDDLSSSMRRNQPPVALPPLAPAEDDPAARQLVRLESQIGVLHASWLRLSGLRD